MARINDHYLKLAAGYLFPEIGRRVAAFSEANPSASLIKLGIGDVTEPLPPAIVAAMHAAVDEMATVEGFHGYGPEQGYDFLRDLIATHDFQARGCEIAADEIFVSDGSKCDTGNFLDILGPGNRIAVADPVYPVYVDTNVMVGNTGPVNEDGEYGGLVYLRSTAENAFTPEVPDEPVDVIYLCYPNNPTGATASKEYLERWVAYAHKHGALILFDAAYHAFIQDPDVPHSIYEIDGARDVAVEFRSFSKNAGFTGTRCAYTVVPKGVLGKTADGKAQALHPLWNRRHCTKFNGVSYVVQRGAAAAYSAEGKREIEGLVSFYMENASIIRENLQGLGFTVFGGENAPYVWLQTPDGLSSWDFFDKLLTETNVVGTPGSGFGRSGEGFFRLSSFNSRANVEEAMQRLRTQLTLG